MRCRCARLRLRWRQVWACDDNDGGQTDEYVTLSLSCIMYISALYQPSAIEKLAILSMQHLYLRGISVIDIIQSEYSQFQALSILMYTGLPHNTLWKVRSMSLRITISYEMFLMKRGICNPYTPQMCLFLLITYIAYFMITNIITERIVFTCLLRTVILPLSTHLSGVIGQIGFRIYDQILGWSVSLIILTLLLILHANKHRSN